MFHLQQPWRARMTEATCSPSQMLGSDKPTMGGMGGEMQKQSSLLAMLTFGVRNCDPHSFLQDKP